MKILVIDGQGGKMGAALTDQIKKNMPLYIKDVLGLADKIKNLSKIYTLKRNLNFQTQSSGLLSVGCLKKTNFPSLQKK